MWYTCDRSLGGGSMIKAYGTTWVRSNEIPNLLTLAERKKEKEAKRIVRHSLGIKYVSQSNEDAKILMLEAEEYLEQYTRPHYRLVV